jgi:hypothetical protein
MGYLGEKQKLRPLERKTCPEPGVSTRLPIPTRTVLCGLGHEIGHNRGLGGCEIQSATLN